MKHNWEYKQLGDVCNILMGQSPSSDSYNDESKGLPFFQGCSDFGKIHPSVTKFCSEPIRIAAENDILFSVRAPIGTMNIANLPCCIGRGLCSFRIHDPNLQKYLFYALNVTKPKIIEKGTGSTFKAVNKDVLHKHIIPVPPMEVQEQIVAELDKINETIEDCRELLRNLDALSQSLFYDYFGDPVTNHKGWEKHKLSEIAKVKIGPFGSLLHKEDYIIGGIPLINPVHMVDGYVRVDNNFTISNSKKNELNNYLLKTNDIIFGRRGDIGRCALITEKENGFLCGTGSLYVRFNGKISPIYSLWVLSEDSTTKYLLEKAKGATMLNINCGIVESVPIILPPLPLQESFARKIEAIEAQKADIEAAIAELQTLLDSRMDYWFN